MNKPAEEKAFFEDLERDLSAWLAFKPRLCAHEAGHAVVAHALGTRVLRIEPGDGKTTGGRAVYHYPKGKDRLNPWNVEAIGHEIATKFGGYISERRRAKDDRARALGHAGEDFRGIDELSPWGGDNHDDNHRWFALWTIINGRDVKSSAAFGACRWCGGTALCRCGWRLFVRAWYRVAAGIIRENWTTVEAIAEELSWTMDDDVPLDGRGFRKLLLPVKACDVRGALERTPIVLEWIEQGRKVESARRRRR